MIQHESNQKIRYWLSCHPDITRPMGGIKQIHRLAEALNSCGREATLIQENKDFHPGWFTSNVPTISFVEWSERNDLNNQKDIMVLPETFIPSLSKYPQKLPTIIFNQNGCYSFGLNKKDDGFPKDPSKVIALYKNPQVIHTICVSRHDENLLIDAMGLNRNRVSRLINAIEIDNFFPTQKKFAQLAFMPRKNRYDAMVVSSLIREQSKFKNWSLIPIHGLPQNKVADILQKSIGFLSFGHPEGFGLPLAEAGACGCALIGYTGLGGRELFQIAQESGVGWPIEFGDWQGFIHAIKELENKMNQEPQGIKQSLQNLSNNIRERYSPQAMIESVSNSLPIWESQIKD